MLGPNGNAAVNELRAARDEESKSGTLETFPAFVFYLLARAAVFALLAIADAIMYTADRIENHG